MRNGITPIRYYHSNSPDHADSMTRELLDRLSESEANPHGPLGALAWSMREDGHSAPDLVELYQSSASVKMLLEKANRLLLESLRHCEKTFHFTRLYEGEWSDRTTNNLTTRKFYDEREWRAVAFDSQSQPPLRFQLADIRHIFVTTKAERKEILDLVNELADSLLVSDPMEICSIVKVGDEFFRDI